MNKAFLEESLNVLNEQDLKESDFRTVRNKMYDFLEHYYEEKIFEFLTEERPTVQEVMQAVPEYNPDWYPEGYTDVEREIEENCSYEIIRALVKADMKSLFLNA